MKKLIQYIKDWFRLVKSVRELEQDIENLETKLLAPVKVNRSFFSGLETLYWSAEPKKPITLEEKVESMARALGIKFEQTQEQDSEVIAKLPKKKK